MGNLLNINLLLDGLWKLADEKDVLPIVKPVLADPRFALWSGSPSPDKHHYGDGGLLRHTYEVAVTADQNAAFYNALQSGLVNDMELFVSCIFHDYGKIWDYQKLRNADDPTQDYWTGTDHKRNIYHITRSGLEWMKVAELLDIEPQCADRVLHNILAHHGRREWGSPVQPNSREAWILHLCDNMSARVCDVETLKRIV